MIRVVPLSVADTEAALALYAELTLGPTDFSPDDFAAVVAHPGTIVFGAKLGDSIAGMVTLHVLPNVTWGGRPYALMENVVTAPSQRRQGIGRHMLSAAVEAAWAAGCYKVMVLTGRKRGAKGFYEAIGFSEEDKHGMVIRQA